MRKLHFIHLLGPESFAAGTDASRLSALSQTARHLDEAGFTALVFPDANGPEAVRAGQPFLPCEPFTACGALAASTRSIGLVAAVPAATSEPYNVARRLASLDHISRGRMGWHLTAAIDGLSEQYGDHSRALRPETPERAAEFTDVVQALWNSWSAEAVIVKPDGASGIDGSGNCPISHEGTFYKVKGPLDVPRPPQGHPVCFQSLTVNDDLDFPARFAEVVMPQVATRMELEGFKEAFLRCLRQNGRSPEQVRIMPHISIPAPDDDGGKVGGWIADWFFNGLADGFCVTGPMNGPLENKIMPRLRKQGLISGNEDRHFLHEQLGLKRP